MTMYNTAFRIRKYYFFTRSHIDATWSIVSCTRSITSCIDWSRSRKPWAFSFCNRTHSIRRRRHFQAVLANSFG